MGSGDIELLPPYCKGGQGGHSLHLQVYTDGHSFYLEQKMTKAATVNVYKSIKVAVTVIKHQQQYESGCGGHNLRPEVGHNQRDRCGHNQRLHSIIVAVVVTRIDVYNSLKGP